MKTIPFFRAFTLSFCALATPPAMSLANTGTPLTLAEALARASEHPRLVAHQSNGRAADALVAQAGLKPVPVLGLSLENFAGTGANHGFVGFEGTVELSQTIERGDKRTHRTALANRARDIVAAEFAVLERQTRAATAAAYVATLSAGTRLALAEIPLTLARETLATVDDRVQAGAASPAESARARVALATAQAEFARATTAFISTRHALAAAWGRAPEATLEIAGTLTVPDELPAPGNFLARLPEHPQLALQQAIVASRRATLRLEQSHAVRDITVAGGVRFLRDGSDAGLLAGISVPLPARNRNQDRICAARETLAGTELTTAIVEQELRAEFTAVWQELTTAHHAVIALRRDALPAAAEAHTIVRQAYVQGRLPLLDVLDAQRELAALRREIMAHEAAFAAAFVRVEALTDPTFTATSLLISFP